MVVYILIVLGLVIILLLPTKKSPTTPRPAVDTTTISPTLNNIMKILFVALAAIAAYFFYPTITNWPAPQAETEQKGMDAQPKIQEEHATPEITLPPNSGWVKWTERPCSEDKNVSFELPGEVAWKFEGGVYWLQNLSGQTVVVRGVIIVCY
jgi:hypothetical protein